jgi:hypothetical protein
VIRSNHYEAAFEAYLRAHQVGFIPVDEAKRSQFGGEAVKSADFIVVGPDHLKLVVDVKGRRFPCGTSIKPRKNWQNWATESDITSLMFWAKMLGSEYRGVLAFVYHIDARFHFPEGTPDLFVFRERTYLIRAVSVLAYRQRMQPRSRKWNTVFLRNADFRDLVKPFSLFLTSDVLEPDERENSPLKTPPSAS